jgi:AcrR family transcriptional regulator
MSSGRSLRVQHAEATRRAVIAAARQAFATEGYTATSIDRVAEAARVTKGAVYHHFEDKRDMFRAVYIELATEVDARVRLAIANDPHPIARVQLAVEAFLACAHDPEIRRIMFLEGMSVLTGECREIDARYFLDLLRSMLLELREAKLLGEVDIDTVAQLVLAALIEAAQMLGRATDIDASATALRGALGALLGGLLKSA